MKLSPSETESIILLLTRIYTDILVLEEEFNLLVGEGDFRPRIEYFHDAIREVSTQDPNHIVAGGRLSVELLAYDLAALRYIGSKPLASFKPHGDAMSASTAVMAPVNREIELRRARPDRAVRDRIVDLYQHYAVLFAALFKPFADRDYFEKTENVSHDMDDLQSLIKEFAMLAKGKGSQERIGEDINHIDDDSLRHELLNFMHLQKHKQKDNLDKLIQFLKAQNAKKDKEIKEIDKAHLNYSLAQLAIYEESKDMIKKMAKSGMNLVGKFVEASIEQSKRDMGR